MNNLSGLLEKFKSLLAASRNNKDVIVATIASVASIKLEDSEIDIRNEIIYVKAHPAVRSSLFMRKKKILEALEAQLSKHAPKDIR